MPSLSRRPLSAVLAGAAVLAVVAMTGPPEPPPPLDARVLTAPQPMPGTDDRTHLVYEILLRNRDQRPVRLDRVEVRARDTLAALDDTAIELRLFRFTDRTFSRTLAPGRSGMLLLDVTLAPGAPVPARLEHRFGVTPGADGASATFPGAPIAVERREPMRLSPPLTGGDLAVIGCCGPPFGHRRASVHRDDGRIHLAQRHAVDFVRMDGELQTSTGDPARNESYHIYGAPVMAAAPGRVLAVRDGVPENTPTEEVTEREDKDVPGNFVLQDLGGGRTALYAHLRTGSVRVRPGDRLERGRVLGEVGNTGMSFQPHLHFQVTDRPGLPVGLTAEGVPFVFDRFRLQRRFLPTIPPKPVSAPVPPPHRRAGQYPLTGDIVAFDRKLPGQFGDAPRLSSQITTEGWRRSHGT